MNIALLLIEALKFIFPAYCANATPVLAGGGTKMDFDKNFIDGKRIFGNNKTWRGFFLGWAVGFLVGIVEGFIFGFDNYPLLFSVLIPLGALLGDLTGAFIKRRIDIVPGGLLPIVDQIDFVVGAVVFALPLALISWQGLSWEVIVIVLLLTPPIHLLTNFIAYKLKLKRHPW
ncbi:MAG: CDP-2,3-bis-(O-geranylgeranyl)-sn-glycerol synthase [Nitrososphaerota archaeon]|jgi:CDP-2,3-bis-(O-geranylgeranyl)-sn-glycerol synthase|uniref:CDP-2,3-bis-(O-geranylgeranyl)-sn-glycerol synthase n=1 Tax=Candidatus Bathycorpusculum sp. TaxID=2994959 RepID=UPI00281B0903|nr:CDP-2,3-bis-(O-geranylgeranyl)-sn-glycerol synthase [Candidatus Termitimicrobium sp.]MCL2431432.1 CDP-2,3-bis-(O-geranylgeranyl)-sn-glycerol synthase [Candidatus Termitimicrobium sp.]MDR0492738.1 CDP-2,3-bis-(O-geranylgeranyl)-sn-glycerol synthase [Nitrososphaerota archaeon]